MRVYVVIYLFMAYLWMLPVAQSTRYLPYNVKWGMVMIKEPEGMWKMRGAVLGFVLRDCEKEHGTLHSG
jgi:hypothetical protein